MAEQPLLYLTSSRITTSERLPDRFLKTGTLSAHHPDYEPLGFLAYVIEVGSPLFAQSPVTELICGILGREYFVEEALQAPPLYHFEHIVKRINQALADLTKTGDTDWVGNLNALIAVIVGRELLVAQTGTAHAFLFRKYKISHITDGLATERSPHPLKTFSNLISGRLAPEDRVVLCNQNLIDYVPLDQLRQIVLTYQPERAAEQVSRLLRREHVKAVGAVFFETSSEPFLKEKKGDESVVYLDQVGRNWLKQLERWLKPLQSALADGVVWLRTTGWPKLLALLRRQAARPRTAREREHLPSAQRKITRAAEPGGVGRKATADWQKRVRGWWTECLLWLRKLVRRRPVVLVLLLVLVLLMVVVLTVRLRRSHQPTGGGQTALAATLSQAREAYTRGVAANDRGDSSQARQAFQVVASLLPTLEASSYRQEASQLKADVQARQDRLDNVVRLPATTALAHLPGHHFTQLGATSKQIFLYEQAKGEVSAVDLPNGQIRVLGSLPSKPAEVSFMTDDQQTFLLTSERTIYQVRTDRISGPLSLAGQSSWSKPVRSGAFFNGALYFLEPTEQRITKLPLADQSFGSSVSYNKEPVATDATFMTIDGSVFVLRPKVVERFEKGKKLGEIALDNLHLTPDVQVVGFTAHSTLYFSLSNNHIAEMGEDGAAQSQVALPSSLGTVEAMTIEPADKLLYVSSGESLYRFSLP